MWESCESFISHDEQKDTAGRLKEEIFYYFPAPISIFVSIISTGAVFAIINTWRKFLCEMQTFTLTKLSQLQ